MGACIRSGASPTNPQPSRKSQNKPKPMVIDSSSNTVQLPKEINNDLLEHLKREAQKTEELQRAKREAASHKRTFISFAKTTLNDANKKTLRLFLEKKDFVSLYEYLSKNKILPHEETSDAGYHWTLIHHACRNKAAEILEFLCRNAYQLFPNDYEKIINSQTFEGFTPLILAVGTEDLPTLKTLMSFGGIDVEIQDRKGLSAREHAKNCKSKEIGEFLSLQKDCKLVNAELLSKMNAEEFYQSWKTSQTKSLNDLGAVNLCNEKPSDEDTLKSITGGAESQVYKLTLECIKNAKNFVDDGFAHKLDNFINNSDERYSQWVLARWLRPHELLSATYSDIKLFDVIDPKSIKQGTLDTCHFLSVLGSLAEYPARVRAIFQQNAINKYGVYALNFFLNGKPREIIVDDYIPCYSNVLEPLFAKPDGNQIWPLILEKAWCKMFGSYSIVEVEVVYEAMEDILGAPSMGCWVHSFSPKEIFQQMFSWDQAKFLVSATTAANTDESTGIVANHTYSILGVYEIPDPSKKQENKENNEKNEKNEKTKEKIAMLRFIKVRNPWGCYEWKGAYADDSAKLTGEIKDMLGYNNLIDDGVFLMTPSEFHNAFLHLSVCMVHDNWVYQYVEVEKPEKSVYFSLNLTKKQEICVRVHQENAKLYNVQKKNYKYCPLELILFSNAHDFIETGADSKYIGKKSVMLSSKGYITLSPGQYFLRVKVHYKTQQETPKKYVVSTYSEENINFKMMSYYEGKELFFQTLTRMGRKSANVTRFQSDSCFFRFDWLDHLGVLHLKNSSTSVNSWKVTIVIEKGENIKIGKKGRDTKEEITEFHAEIPAKSETIFLVKKIRLHEAARFSKKIYESFY